MVQYRMKQKLAVSILLCCTAVGGCSQNQIDRLRQVGQEPPLLQVQNPVEKSQPISWPTKNLPVVNEETATNSLWVKSSNDYFRDKRAHSVGDILMVHVEINDKAEIDNRTERTRTNSEGLGAPNLFGLERLATNFLPGTADTSNLLSVDGNSSSTGEGIIEREEEIETEVAAVVTRVMSNGNMMIYGSQEIRVNHEIRQLTIEGVINPGDISTQNTISSSRIAEARISYGGRGIISDVQQPRVGNQIIDILSPW